MTSAHPAETREIDTLFVAPEESGAQVCICVLIQMQVLTLIQYPYSCAQESRHEHAMRMQTPRSMVLHGLRPPPRQTRLCLQASVRTRNEPRTCIRYIDNRHRRTRTSFRTPVINHDPDADDGNLPRENSCRMRMSSNRIDKDKEQIYLHEPDSRTGVR